VASAPTAAGIYLVGVNRAGVFSPTWDKAQVDGIQVRDQTITATQIANATITYAQIANATITEANIANLAVTDAKINSMSADKLTAGTIDASVISVTNLNASNITTGSLSVTYLTGWDGGAINVGTGVVFSSSVNAENFLATGIYGVQASAGPISASGTVTAGAGFISGTTAGASGNIDIDVTQSAVFRLTITGGLVTSSGWVS
jgi:flagellar basal body P-ring protein FlgI